MKSIIVALALIAQPVPNQTPIQKVNINCGLPPLPPIGCSVGACQCDASGENCQWTFNCN